MTSQQKNELIFLIIEYRDCRTRSEAWHWLKEIEALINSIPEAK